MGEVDVFQLVLGQARIGHILVLVGTNFLSVKIQNISRCFWHFAHFEVNLYFVLNMTLRVKQNFFVPLYLV